MAYYDPGCVERIRAIRQLQDRHRLSLVEIGKLLASPDGVSGLSLEITLHDVIFGRERPAKVIRTREFLRETGLTRGQLALLVEASLLQPLEKGRFDPEDVEMGKICARALAAGAEAADLAYYVELGEKIVDREMELRSRMTLPSPCAGRRTHDRDGQGRPQVSVLRHRSAVPAPGGIDARPQGVVFP